MCEISYTGNNVDTDKATTNSVTINGNTLSFSKSITDFNAISGNVDTLISDSSITVFSVLTTTSTDISDMDINTGECQVYIQIFYPSTELTGNIEININGTPQMFNFVKIPTS